MGLTPAFLAFFFFFFGRLISKLFVTLHQEMSRNVPDGHFHVFIFSESIFYAIYNGQKPCSSQRTSGRAICF